MAEREDDLKSLLMKMKEETEKAGLKLNIQKMITASSIITLGAVTSVPSLPPGRAASTGSGPPPRGHWALGAVTSVPSLPPGRAASRFRCILQPVLLRSGKERWLGAFTPGLMKDSSCFHRKQTQLYSLLWDQPEPCSMARG